MLHVGARDLVGAFNRHRSVANTGNTDSHLLLLTYAAECGLKWLILQRRGVHTTARLDDDDLTHDLDILLNRLGSPRRVGSYRTASPGGVSITANSLHQVFRYGARLRPEDRERVIAALRAVIEWVEDSA
jgi:hypothetical protein